MAPIDLLKLLLDRDRLAVAGAFAAAPGTVTAAEIAGTAGVEQRDALLAIAALLEHGVVARDGDGYRLDDAGLRSVARELAVAREPAAPDIGFGMTQDEQVVLDRWFEGRSLTSIPTKRSQRLVILERLALEFEPGRRYAEPEVNSILGAFNPDWSALRRYLVDEGLLDRDNNQYWRSGGRVL